VSNVLYLGFRYEKDVGLLVGSFSVVALMQFLWMHSLLLRLPHACHMNARTLLQNYRKRR
jgi:hypothetical protein